MATRNIAGLQELHRALQDFPVKFEKSVLRGGMRAGGKVFERIAAGKIPVRSGKLRNSLKVRTRSKRGQVTVEITLGDKNAFYGHMVENGTAAHFLVPRKKVRGMAKRMAINGTPRTWVKHPGAKPNPIMRNTFDEGQEQALAAFRDYVYGRIMRGSKL